MDICELLATHTDCADFGEIEENLLFEFSSEDYEDFYKSADFTDFYMWNLNGAKIEMMYPDKSGFTIYLSAVGKSSAKCYLIQYTPNYTKIIELKAKEGELQE